MSGPDFDWERDSVPAEDFDWERDSQAADAPAQPTTTKLGALGRGLANTFSLGDERDGLIGAWIEGANRLREGEFPGWKDPVATAGILRDAYVDSRDRTRALQAADSDQHLGVSLLGNVGGNAMFGPVGGARSVLGLGAVAGVGASEADSLPGMASDGVIGAGLSYLGGKAGEKLVKGAGTLVQKGAGYLSENVGKPIAQGLQDFAAKRAMNAAGYIQKDLKPLFRRDPDSVRRAGEAILNEPGVINIFDNITKIEPRMEPVLQKYGQMIGRALKAADDQGARFDMEPFLQRVERDIIAPDAGDPAAEPLLRKVRDLVTKYRELARQRNGAPGLVPYGTDVGPQRGITFTEANRMKGNLQDLVAEWGNPMAIRSASDKGRVFIRKMQHDFLEEIDDQLGEDVLGAEGKALFKEAKRRYGVFREASDVAREGMARREGNNMFSIWDGAVGSSVAPLAATALENPLGALAGFAGMAASKQVRERASATMARTASGLAKARPLEALAKSNPEAFGKFAGSVSAALARGPDALRATLHVLQAMPQFRVIAESLEKDEEEQRRLAERP